MNRIKFLALKVLALTFVVCNQSIAEVVEHVVAEPSVPVAEPASPAVVEAPAAEVAPVPAAPQIIRYPAQQQGIVLISDAPPIQLAVKEEAEPVVDTYKHEVKLDALHAMLSTLKVGYEYYIDNRQSLGVSALYNFSNKPDLRDGEAQVEALAGYKLYIIKPRRGPSIFFEGDVGFVRGYHDPTTRKQYNRSVSDSLRVYNAFTVGLSGGIKFFVPGMDIGLETSVGAGRVYSYNLEGYEDDVLPYYGVSLIRRF